MVLEGDERPGDTAERTVELSDVGGYNPGLREYLKNATAKYGAYSEDDLAKAALQSRPYRNAHKDNNGGKWNKPIDDRDIYAYQKSIKK